MNALTSAHVASPFCPLPLVKSVIFYRLKSRLGILRSGRTGKSEHVGNGRGDHASYMAAVMASILTPSVCSLPARLAHLFNVFSSQMGQKGSFAFT